MTFNDQIKNDLKDTLSFKGRFSHYQELPPCVLNRLNEIDLPFDYQRAQLPLDSSRYSWIISNVDTNNLNVIDIGANLGYFSIRLASEANANVHAYEALKEYAKSIELFSRVCDLEDKLKVTQQSINLNEILDFKNIDLTLHLNVLHHAGVFFDSERVKTTADWYDYAVDHLRLMSNISEKIVIQIGNMWNDQLLFDSKYSIDYICGLLAKGNWDVKKIGIITNFDDFSYDTYSVSDVDSIPRIAIWRNPSTGLVEYKDNDRIIAELPSGNAQRPIFLCERREV
ncbi:MAG: hypothetical protein ACJ0BE_01575 [Dehalococcoidia bacterium]